MHTSQRVNALKPSSTLAVTARAKQLRADGVDVISFAAGEPDFDTPQPIKQAAIDALQGGMTKYAPVPGDVETRQVIAEKLERDNGITGLTPDHVVISAGGKQSLYLIFQTILDPGVEPSEVLVPVPAWVSYVPQIQLAGGTPVELPTDTAGAFKITPDQLRAAITPRTRALVLNSPSNPCGTMYSPAELQALADVIADAAESTAPDLVVISDEIYEKIILADIPHFSIGSVARIADRVITVNGMSKAYAMTGWRIGYAACPGSFGLEVTKGMRKLQSQSTTSVSTFLLPAVRVAIRNCDGAVEEMRQSFASRGCLLFSLMSEIPDIECPRPTGAFYLFVDVSAHFGKTSPGGTTITSAMQFAEALLNEAHLAVVPGEDFGTGGERCCRLTFATGEAQIREGAKRLATFITSLR